MSRAGLVFTLLLAGCLQLFALPPSSSPPALPPSPPDAASSCISACQKAKADGQTLDKGPCLLNPIPQIPAFVCDVAHVPRTAADDNLANQCSAYGQGNITRFIEVRPTCELIRTH